MDVNANPDLADDTFAAEEDTQLSGSVFSDNGNGADDLGNLSATVTAFDSVSANGGDSLLSIQMARSPTTQRQTSTARTPSPYTVTDADGDTDTATRDGRRECRARPCYRPSVY